MRADSLRHVAIMAKERMKSGYWKETRDPNFARISENAPKALPVRGVDSDPEFRAKVKAIMESREEVINPIRLLVDEGEYQRADYIKKQKMILETSARYHMVRTELQREQAGK